MKITTITLFLFLMLSVTNLFAQSSNSSEKYGNTLNLGLGIGGYSGYYGYVGHSIPVLHADYEFDVAKNFTLAPFISYYSYRTDYYTGNPHDGNWYYYHETVIPVGIKGSYYFDNLIKAGPKWDFYLACSLGFAIAHSYWDNGYNGDNNVGASPLFFDLHIGTEYHFNQKLGAFFDLSTGVSTIGLAIHKF
ncbi:MAG: hypothetical protein NTW49_06005 [Bacteroidia bacterium]|nr:hypothetical protein [Bacteroidia bacterium]